jgi:hypothetical protein
MTDAGIGFRRHKVTFTGEGGHSWGASASRAASRGYSTSPHRQIRCPGAQTIYNVGVIWRHIVNSIAAKAVMLIDMRSVQDERWRRLRGMPRGPSTQGQRRRDVLRDEVVVTGPRRKPTDSGW